MVVIGREPSYGKRSRFSMASIFVQWVAAQVGFCLSSHSSAMASKLFAAASTPAARAIFFCSPGPTPSVSRRRAWSDRLRASFRPTLGYTPRARHFSLPLMRYFSRQYFPPRTETSNYRPSRSKSRYLLGRALALLAALSESDIVGGYLLFRTSLIPPRNAPKMVLMPVPVTGNFRTGHPTERNERRLFFPAFPLLRWTTANVCGCQA